MTAANPTDLSTSDHLLGTDSDAIDRRLLIALQRWESEGGAVLPPRANGLTTQLR